MIDYTWPSIYFAYLFFAICLVLAIFFFIRSLKDGYWNKSGEDIKFHVFDEQLANAGEPILPGGDREGADGRREPAATHRNPLLHSRGPDQADSGGQTDPDTRSNYVTQ